MLFCASKKSGASEMESEKASIALSKAFNFNIESPIVFSQIGQVLSHSAAQSSPGQEIFPAVSRQGTLDKLVKCDENTKWTTLDKVADIGTGSSNTNEGLNEGAYPFYVRSQEPLRKNEYEFDETAIITAGDGVGVGKVYHYVEGKYALHQRAYRIHIKTEDILPKYYFYYMKSAFLPYIQKTMFQGSVASIRRPMLNAFPVPVPSIAEQERIINALDRINILYGEMFDRLSSEIEGRQKQYEYYRDKLLTFKELSV